MRIKPSGDFKNLFQKVIKKLKVDRKKNELKYIELLIRNKKYTNT